MAKHALPLRTISSIKQRRNPKGVAFFDIRTLAEVLSVGWPSPADALVPYVEHPELKSDWDDQRQMYKLEPNQDCRPELGSRLKEMGLGKDATIILVCRSGERSSKAQGRLQMAGYTKVSGIAEGIDGDMAKEGLKAGQRVVNGWKSAGLP